VSHHHVPRFRRVYYGLCPMIAARSTAPQKCSRSFPRYRERRDAWAESEFRVSDLNTPPTFSDLGAVGHDPVSQGDGLSIAVSWQGQCRV